MFITVNMNTEQTQATMTLNRIDKANALNKAFIQQLIEVLDKLKTVSSLKVCVIESAAKHFCVGADLTWLQDSLHLTAEENIADVRSLADLLNKLYALPCVTIAKVHGCVYGGGLGILACCDFVLAADDSQFCFSEINLGIAAATIAPYVRNKLSLQTMRQLMLTARPFNAEQAKQFGLVDEVYMPSEESSKLTDLVNTMLAKSKHAMVENKQMLAELSLVHSDVIETSIHRLATMRQSDHSQSCLRDFLQRLEDKKSS